MFFFEELQWNEGFVRTGFLTKSGDKKGHVFELLFSDELYNFARGGEERSIFGYKSFCISSFCLQGGKKEKKWRRGIKKTFLETTACVCV